MLFLQLHLDSAHEHVQKDEKEVDFFADCHHIVDNNVFTNNLTNNNYELSSVGAPADDEVC